MANFTCTFDSFIYVQTSDKISVNPYILKIHKKNKLRIQIHSRFIAEKECCFVTLKTRRCMGRTRTLS